MAQPLWKTVWQFYKMVNVDLPYDPAIVLHQETEVQKLSNRPSSQGGAGLESGSQRSEIELFPPPGMATGVSKQVRRGRAL